MEVDRSTTTTATIQEQQNIPAPPDNKLSIENPGHSAGLSVPKSTPEDPDKKKAQEIISEPIVIVPTSTRTPARERKNRELAKLRQLKWQQQQAFNSPLRLGSAPQNNGSSQKANHVPPANGNSTNPLGNMPAMPEMPQGEYNPADQRDKEAFLSKRSSGTDEWTLKHSRTQGSPFELKTGSVIPGIMLSGINSSF